MSWVYRSIAVWGLGIIGVLGTVIAGFFHSRLRHVEQQSITKEYFKERLKEVDDQRLQFHRENIEKLSEIQAAMKSMYQHAVDIGRMQEQIKALQGREAHLSGWKHKTVDAYIPGAVDELKRRVDSIERNQNRSNSR